MQRVFAGHLGKEPATLNLRHTWQWNASEEDWSVGLVVSGSGITGGVVVHLS